ncbi:MAG: hypothetical protein ACLU0O_08920 [Collinsella sp.]
MTGNEIRRIPAELAPAGFGVAMPEEQHAHSPYSRAALPAEALQAVEAGLDAGEDVTLAVSQSAARYGGAQFARRPRPTVYIVSGEDAADRAARSLAAYVGLAHVWFS